MRFIAAHTGDLIVSRLLAEMYSRYQHNEWRVRRGGDAFPAYTKMTLQRNGHHLLGTKDKDNVNDSYPIASSNTSTTTEHEQAVQRGYIERLDYVDAPTLPKGASAPPLTDKPAEVPPSPTAADTRRGHYPGPPPPQMPPHMP